MLTRIILGLIRFYRYFLSPLTFSSCRFAPTCSAYALEAVERFGPAKGMLLAVWRLMKCHPFHPGGYDPVGKPPIGLKRAFPVIAPAKDEPGMPTRDEGIEKNGGFSWKNARFWL